jgi:electron transport complex protein RnfG
MLIRSVYRNALILGAFALVSIGLNAIFNYITEDKIKAEMQAKLARTLGELVPPSRYDNDVYHDCVALEQTERPDQYLPARVYRMTKAGQPVAVVFSVTAPDGYNGRIELLMGVNYDESIAGISVIQHNETPGLGDKIEPRKSNWLQQFKGLSLTNTPAEDWKVKKDGGRFDAFTGATITPRAVLKAIARGLAFFHANKSVIFNSPNSCGVQHE